MSRCLVCKDSRNRLTVQREDAENETEHLHTSQGEQESDLRSFIVDLTTEDRDPKIAPFADVLPQRLLDKVSIDGYAPSQVHSAERGDRRSGVDGICEGGIRSTTETFQSVWGRSASGELDQVVVGCLVFLTVDLVEGKRVARFLVLNRVVSDVEIGFRIVKTYENSSLEWRVWNRGKVGDN